MTEMIRTSGLVKRFGKVTALDGLDLAVPRGTILGLLGPNGAGKTTAVRILTTLLEPDGGTATVAGLDVAAEPDKVRERIGLSGQNAAVDEYLTGYENLEMVVSDSTDIPSARSILAELSAGEIRVEEHTCTVTAAVTGGVDVLRRVLQLLKDRSVPVDDVGLRRPTLDDVFLSLTGHAAEEVAESPDGKRDGQKAERAEAREKEAVR